MKKAIYLLFCLILVFACSTKNTSDAKTDEPVTEAEPFKANRILIKHGLQLQCWVATDNYELGGAAGQPAYNMNPEDWKLTGFTAPTFFGPPLINDSYFEYFPDSQWAVAKAPYGDQLSRGPYDFEKNDGFLSANHKKHLERLVSICFGDEEYYKFENVLFLKEWYNIVREFYPDVLVHNNQYAGQWNENDLRTYIRVSKPDMITYDWYYFHSWDADNYLGAKDMAEHLMIYRNLALEGLNGDGEDYLAFGQYSQGFVNEGTYKLSESQLRLYYYMTWTFGGKWLNWFRYLQGDGYGGTTSPTHWSLLLENGMPGMPTKYMDWVYKCNQESKYIGDYLVRLKTTDVLYIAGSDKYKEGTPARMLNFNPHNGFLRKIEGRLISDPTQSGDLYVGHFHIIPSEEKGDPAFFENPSMSFFMITNGLVSKKEELAYPVSQLISITVDMSNFQKKKLYWINPDNGKKEELQEESNESTYLYMVQLKGGSGALFMIE